MLMDVRMCDCIVCNVRNCLIWETTYDKDIGGAFNAMCKFFFIKSACHPSGICNMFCVPLGSRLN